MMLFVLLGACVCMGLSNGSDLERLYGDQLSFRVPENADYLEFKHPLSPSVTLWRRGDAGDGARRGQLTGNRYEMEKLTQADDGLYMFRDKNRRLIYDNTIKVSEYTKYYDKMVGEDLFFDFALDPALCYLTFFPEGDTDSYRIFRKGNRYDYFFDDRIQVIGRGTISVSIDDLQTSDSGRFELRDLEGNLALVVTLEVQASPALYIGVAVGIIAMVVFCCCYVRKCCCKKSSSKRDSPVPPTADALPLYYHEHNTEPTGPAYASQPSQPSHLTYPREPSHTSHGSLVPATGAQGAAPPSPLGYDALSTQAHNSTTINVPATGAQGAAPPSPLGYDALSSDPEPQFKLKGLDFPFTLPLSSDTTTCDVYTSDKLNFL
ncbi:uncharacterized protein ACJ7VT_005814 isoform 2-T2 [Polymixia lowei]